LQRTSLLNVFAVHGVDGAGKPALVRPSVARNKLLELIAALPARLIGMEACLGAHHWAREFQKLGHIVRPLKAAVVRAEAMKHLEELPGWANTVMGDLLSEVSRLDERIARYDRHIAGMARQSTPARQLMQLAGIGELTATAMVSTIGNGNDVACGRSLAAWLGLVPSQYSSGGKKRLGCIKNLKTLHLACWAVQAHSIQDETP
jgi:transposase